MGQAGRRLPRLAAALRHAGDPRPARHRSSGPRPACARSGSQSCGSATTARSPASRCPRPTSTRVLAQARGGGGGGGGGGLPLGDPRPRRPAQRRVQPAASLTRLHVGKEMWGTSRWSTMRPLAASTARGTAPRPVEAAGHGDVVGDRQQQRPGLGVGVAGRQHGVDLEGGSARAATGRRTSSGTRRPRTPRGPGSARLPSMVGRAATTPSPRSTADGRGRPLAGYAAAAGGGDRGGRAGLGRALAWRTAYEAWAGETLPPDVQAQAGGGRRGRLEAEVDPQVRAAAGHRRRRAADQPARDPAGRGAPPHRGAPGGRRAAGRAGRRRPSACSPTTSTTSAPPPSPTSTRRCTSPGIMWGAAKAHVVLQRRRRGSSSARSAASRRR